MNQHHHNRQNVPQICFKVQSIAPQYTDQSKIVDCLIRENQFLKQQLQQLIKSTQVKPKNNQNQNHLQRTQSNAHEFVRSDPLRMQQSARVSTQGCNFIHSPRLSQGVNQTQLSHRYDGHMNLMNQCNFNQPVTIADPRLKTIIVSKDSQGKYYRNHELEHQIINIRSNQSSVSKTTPSSTRRQTPVSTPNKGNTTVMVHPGAHLNIENKENKLKKHTIRLNSPTFLKNKSVRKEKENLGKQCKNRFDQLAKQQAMASLRQKRNQLSLQQNHTARRNVYVEQDWIKEGIRCQARLPTLQYSQGDSQISIQKQLREARHNRKLNCGVYLQEQRS